MITEEQAADYKWWKDFLEARMIAIQSMLALEKSEVEIYSSVSVTAVQMSLLIETARERQQ